MAIQDTDLLLVNRGQQSKRATVKQIKDYVAGTQDPDDAPGFIFTGATLPNDTDEVTFTPRQDTVAFGDITVVQFIYGSQVSQFEENNLLFITDRATGSSGTYKILTVNTSSGSITVDYLVGAVDNVNNVKKGHALSFIQCNPADFSEDSMDSNAKVYVGITQPNPKEQGTLWWHPTDNELRVFEDPNWELVTVNYLTVDKIKERYLSSLSNASATQAERTCDGQITFAAKAYSTATVSSDQSSTLTTKGYVDNAIASSGGDSPPERLDPEHTKSILEFGAKSNGDSLSGGTGNPDNWDYDGYIESNTVAFTKAFKWVCGALNYDDNGNEIPPSYDNEGILITPGWTNRALYFPAGRYRTNRVDTSRFQGENCNANIYGDGDSSIIEAEDDINDTSEGSGAVRIRPKSTRFTIQMRNLQISPGIGKTIRYALEINYIGGGRGKLDGPNDNDLNYFSASGWQGWNNTTTRGGGGGADRNFVTLQNITISRWNKQNPNEDQNTTFLNGICILNAKRPILENVTVWGYKKYVDKDYGVTRDSSGNIVSRDYSKYSQLSLYTEDQRNKTIGLNLDGCYKPVVSNCYVNGQYQIGLSCFTGTEGDGYVDEEGNFVSQEERSEGFLIQNTTITGSYYNVCIRTAPKQAVGDSRPIDISKMQRHPEITVKDCHFSGKGICLYFIGLKYLDIRNNLIFMDGKQGIGNITSNPHRDVPNQVQAIDVRLDACSYVQLEGNKYASGGSESIKRVHVFAQGSNNVTCHPGALDAPLNIASNDCPQWWFRAGGDYAKCNKITVDIDRTPRKDYFNSNGKPTPKVSFASDTGDYLFVYRNNTIESLTPETPE